MTGVFFDPSRNDEAWRNMIYDGNIIVLSPTPEMLVVRICRLIPGSEGRPVDLTSRSPTLMRSTHHAPHLPFAAGNFLGPVLLGRLFDTVGRRPMIATTYALSGVLLAGAGYLFAAGVLSATGQTIAWMVIFFFASAAASSAYLTVSETFPLEVRALAIAFFYALGTGVGGVAGPWVFGALIDTGSRWSLYGGYLIGSVLMLAAAMIAARYGVAAERKPLESVSRPLAATD